MSDVVTEEAVRQDAPEPPRRRGPLPPVLYPILAAAFGVLLVWAASRIFLAVTELDEVDLGFATIKGKYVTAVIALFLALNILVGAALVAYGRRVRGRPASWPLLVCAGVVLVAGGVTAVALGNEEEAPGGPPPFAASISASGLQFSTGELDLPADAPVDLTFDNQDDGVQHNVAIYTDESASQPLFKGELVTGVASVVYSFTAPPPGSYYFHCDVHPTMNGSVVTAEAPPGGGGGPGGGPSGGPSGGPGSNTVSLVAQGIAFDTTELTVASGGPVTIDFDNQDANTPHNVSVYADEEGTQSIFLGDLVTGPATAEYTFDAPPPGSYFFRCDVHPDQMKGTLTVT
jgi:plastocyanin